MTVDPQRLKALFPSAAEIAAPAERAAFVDRECGHDAELRRRLEMLLHAHDDSGGFLASAPTVDPAPAGDARAHGGGEAAGDVIGPYKLLQPIGEGGMGVVFLAEQSRPVQRRVALKILKPGISSRQVIARFEAERQALALMDHPNIAKVFDAGCTATGRPYFVMELVKGTPIITYCDEHRLPLPSRLELFVSVCQAIQHAHQKGIIHRDIKPSNVLVAPFDGKPVIKVIDFGIAKATGPKLTERTLFTEFGTVVGTLQYMSPEQAELNNLDIDTRSDIYSLGVLLYELLTGTTPLDLKQLQGAAFAAILMRIQEQEPPRPSARLRESKETLPSISAQRQAEPAQLQRQVRGDLDWIVMKSLAKERERRYETASAFAADVERFLRIEPIQARPPSVRYRLRKFVRRNKRGVAAATIALFGLCFGIYMAYDSMRSLNRANRQFADANIEHMLYLNFLENHVLLGPEPRNPNRTVREGLDRASKIVADCCQGRPRVEAKARKFLGVAYMDVGADRPAEMQLTKAVQLYRLVMDRDKEEGRFDEAGLFAMSSLARLYAAQKRYDEEEPLRVEVVERYRDRPKDYSDVVRHNRAFALFDLGNCYFNQARWLQAEAILAEVIQECRALETAMNQILSKEYLCSRALVRHARCLLARDAFAEAEGELREGLSLMNREAPDSPDRAKADFSLAEALIGQRKYTEAESLLLAHYEAAKQRQDKAPPQGKLHLREALKRLVQLYEVSGNKDEAAKRRKELEEMTTSAPKLATDENR